MTNLWQKLTFSGEMKLLGLAGAVLTVIQTANEPSFKAGLMDIKLWLAIVMALQGFFGKSNDSHGTPENPISPEQAAKVSAVAQATVVESFVGEPIGTSKEFFSVKPGDPAKTADRVNDPRGQFEKLDDGVYKKVGA